MRKFAISALIIALLITLIIFVIYTVYLFSIPQGSKYISGVTYCAKINGDGEIEACSGRVSLFGGMLEDSPGVFKWDFRYLAYVLRSIDSKPVDKHPTDVQIVEFSFMNYDDFSFQKIWEKSVAYDFYTKQLYVFEKGNWYRMMENDALSKLILSDLEYSLRYSNVIWRGQSIYSREEFTESDFGNATFRYNLYWTVFPKYGESFDIQWTGFKNTEVSPINSREDAVALAAKELGYDNPVAVTMYDETCGYYMVEIGNDNGNGVMQIVEHSFEQMEPIYTVVIDNMGRTLEIYKGFTRARPFLQES